MTNTYGIEYIYQNNGTAHVSSIYPEWARMEKFYNCENFTQLFAKKDSIFSRLFGRKRA